jgi:hypothetical protein
MTAASASARRPSRPLLVEESPDRHHASVLIPELARGGCVTNVQPSATRVLAPNLSTR